MHLIRVDEKESASEYLNVAVYDAFVSTWYNDMRTRQINRALKLENMFNEPIKGFEVPVTVQCQHY